MYHRQLAENGDRRTQRGEEIKAPAVEKTRRAASQPAVTKNPSVVIHFKDAAFDDTHVSVPHNLVPEGERNGRHTQKGQSVVNE